MIRNSVEIYNIANEGYSSWPLVFVFAVAILTMAIFHLQLANMKPLISKIVFGCAFGIAVSVLLAYTIQTWSSYNKLVTALNENRCGVVEGRITQFNPGGKDGHGTESFVVSGKRFEYGQDAFRSGYDKTIWEGGGLREGLHVKIWSYLGRIAKIEVQK